MSDASDASQLDKSTTEEVWRSILTPKQYSVLRQRGTDPAFSGAYTDLKAEGVYLCAACGAPLYGSATKFRSGCGWPSFYQELPDAVDRREDCSHGMRRVEITCARCGSHLGHVFEGEGFKTPTDQRHCVNSTSLKFKPIVEGS